MIFVWIICSLIIFSVIVLIHEYGHFKTARVFGVRVEEFGLWIPPRAKKIYQDKKWTLYSLNWLPLWGFVKLSWEQARSFLIFDSENKKIKHEKLLEIIQSWEDIFDKSGKQLEAGTREEIEKILLEDLSDHNLWQKPAWQQSIIILAGVFMNFLLSTVIFSLLFFFWVQPIWINNQLETERKILLIPTTSQALELWLIQKEAWVRISPIGESIAQKSGLMPNDVVMEIDNQELISPQNMMDIVWSNPWKQLSFSVTRGDETLKLTITPSSDWKIWAYLWENIRVDQDFRYKFWAIKSIQYWISETYNQTLLTFQALWSLIRKIFAPETKTERTEAIQQVSGPIWIVDFISGALENGIVFLIIIWAIISINLAVFNLLPIPALDWGRFVLIVLNACVVKIFWKRAIGHGLESMIHVWFFVFLILLSILIAYNDILKISSN